MTKLTLTHSPNPPTHAMVHGCGFGVSHLSLTGTHNQVTHTHISHGFPIPVTGTTEQSRDTYVVEAIGEGYAEMW